MPTCNLGQQKLQPKYSCNAFAGRQIFQSDCPQAQSHQLTSHEYCRPRRPEGEANPKMPAWNLGMNGRRPLQERQSIKMKSLGPLRADQGVKAVPQTTCLLQLEGEGKRKHWNAKQVGNAIKS